MSQPVTVPPSDMISGSASSTWIRMRSLTYLRWVAIVGQSIALAIAVWGLGLWVPLGPCAVVIGVAVIANLVFTAILPESYRLANREAAVILLFDVAQLTLLIALTGGLHNPFAMLFVVPVTISATALPSRWIAVIALATIFAVGLVWQVHTPVYLPSGEPLLAPLYLEMGMGLAVLVSVGFLGLYVRRVSGEIRSMSEGLLATQMALARSQKLTDLGAVVAAAAHELGTPLATIKLVSAELIEELADRPDTDALKADAVLIREQADRCRDILRSMGQVGKDDLHMRRAPLQAILEEAAEPHISRGKEVLMEFKGQGPQPEILRSPELLHGLRNLIQNAVDFADSTVWVDGQWTSDRVRVRILDDGPGYPPALLGRIGDPFLRSGREETRHRPGYEGMGLGLFIAKTLLERTGARLNFANGTAAVDSHGDGSRTGAIIELSWRRSQISPLMAKGGLGENLPIKG